MDLIAQNSIIIFGVSLREMILNLRSMDALSGWCAFALCSRKNAKFLSLMMLLERRSWTKLIIFGASLRGRALWSAGNTGRATILTGRDHGEDGRQPRYCRGKTRREARRARLHQQALYTQIRPAAISRSRQCQLDPLFGWCTNCHGAQKGTLDRAETHVNIRPALSFADSTANE